MRAGSLAHGEKRLLELAVAIVQRPALLLLDEPMAGTGREETAQLVKILRELKGRQAILLVEHDMEAVFALADRISVLVYGRLIATGRPEAIRANDEVSRPIWARLRRERAPGGERAGIGLWRQPDPVWHVAVGGARRGGDAAWPQRHGQDDDHQHDHGPATPAPRRDPSLMGRRCTESRRSASRRRGSGSVPEGRQVFPTLTVEENLVATAGQSLGWRAALDALRHLRAVSQARRPAQEPR
jgi:ABC-type multidrug transport system ATPase subunit